MGSLRNGGIVTGAVVMGIDVGTSGTKAIAVDTEGRVLASAIVGYEMQVPASGWAEQRPEDWWQATIQAVRRVLTRLDAGTAGEVPIKINFSHTQIAAISFSGQMHGLVPLDGQGQVIRPALIWCDLRSAPQAQWMEQEIGRNDIISWTENPPLPNFTATKLLWMRQHEPQPYGRLAKILLPKDYVRYRMTGQFAMDAADASGTLLYDVAHRHWSEDICHALDLPMTLLPDSCESTDVVGHVTAEAAALLGVAEGTPVVAGAGDQAAGAVGLGVVDPGLISAVFGTSGVVLAPTAEPLRDPAGRLHTFCHALGDRWFTMGVTQAAGGSLQWYRRRFGQAEESVAQASGTDAYDLLLAEAAKVSPGAEGLLYLPYLLGERTPHLNPDARGAFVGLDWRHDKSHVVRAILEGVAFSLRDVWELLADLGTPLNQVRVSGGGAQGRLWMEIFSSVLNRPVETMGGAQGPAYGAAMLAAHGVGMLDLHQLAGSGWMAPGTLVSSPMGWPATYAELYSVFRRSYPALAGVYKDLAEWKARQD